MEETKLARYVAEFFGTFVLVLSVGCNVLSKNWFSGPISTACILVGLVYATSNVSGGYLNPALALASGVAGRLPMGEALAYCVFEILGGILGAITYSLLYWENFTIGPMRGFSWWQAGLAEMLYTFMLAFAVLNCATMYKQFGRQYFGLAIGFVILAAGYGGGAISGGCLNPALALGVDLTSVHLGFGWSCSYIGFEFVGAAIAGALFRVIRPQDPGHGQYNKGLVYGVLGEFIGTFMIVLTVGLNQLADSRAAALSTAAAVVVMTYSLWDVCGANFNPAVTLAVVVSGSQQRFPNLGMTSSVVGRALALIGAQIVAALLATWTYLGLHRYQPYPASPPILYGWVPQATVEILFTFLLCYVVLSTATERSNQMLTQYVGIAIGFCILAGGYVTHTVSDGTMNPAVTFSIGLSGSLTVAGCLSLIGCELIGAALAAGLLRLTHPYRKDMAQNTPLKL